MHCRTEHDRITPCEGLGPKSEVHQIGKCNYAFNSTETDKASCNVQAGDDTHSETELQHLRHKHAELQRRQASSHNDQAKNPHIIFNQIQRRAILI